MRRILLIEILLLLFSASLAFTDSIYPGNTVFVSTSASAGASFSFTEGLKGGNIQTAVSERGFFIDKLELGITASYNYFTQENSTADVFINTGIIAGYNIPIPASMTVLPFAGLELSFPIDIEASRQIGLVTGCELNLHLYERSKLILSTDLSIPLFPAPRANLSISVGVKKVIPYFLKVKPVEPMLILSSTLFSPDNDGVADKLIMKSEFDNPESVKKWILEIKDKNNKSVLRRSGTAGSPGRITWDGSFDNGDFVSSADDYIVSLFVEDILGRKSSVSENILIDVLVIIDGDKIKINIPNIIFPPESADFSMLTAQADIEKNEMIIRRLAEIFTRFEGYDIRIEGHANSEYWYDEQLFSVEQAEELLPLSLARAERIMEALTAAGIDPERITVAGLGAEEPLIDFQDEENNWKNRRVEFILVK